MINRYPGKCAGCGGHIAAGAGVLTREDGLRHRTCPASLPHSTLSNIDRKIAADKRDAAHWGAK